MNIKFIQDDLALYRAFQNIAAQEAVGLDIETVGLDPFKGRIRTVQISTPGFDFVIDMDRFDPRRLQQLRELVCNPSVVKLAHNAKYELKWLTYYFGGNHDPDFIPESWYCSQLAEQLILADRIFEYSLADVAEKYLGVTLDKTLQTSDWGAATLTPEQLEYAARDAHVMFEIRVRQVAELIRYDLMRTAYIEFNALPAIAEAELNGFHMDADKWRALLEKKIVERDEAHAKLIEMLQQGVNWTVKNTAKHSKGAKPVQPTKPAHPKRSKAGKLHAEMVGIEQAMQEYTQACADYEQALAEYRRRMEEWHAMPSEVGATINLDSHDQVKRSLKNLGVPLPVDRKTGKESTREHLLLPLENDYPVIAALLDYRGKQKSVTSYGQNWLDKLDEDGRIRPDFEQIGAPTGRMACREPNTQQVPHDEAHRSCFTAPEGRVLCISDYSQIELRILAEFSGDALFCEAFNSGADLHRSTAAMVNGVGVEDVTKEQRDYAKRLNFGLVYGIGAARYAMQCGIELDKAKDIMRRYFATYTGNAAWLNSAEAQGMNEGFARTASGRLWRMTFDPDDKQARAMAGRNAKNHPVQGTAADMFKEAFALVWRRLKQSRLSAFIVNFVHDELVTESSREDAEAVKKIQEETLREVGCRYISRVPVLVESKIADVWAK